MKTALLEPIPSSTDLTPARQDALLDRALEDTFPASDPISPSYPSSIS